MRLADKHALFFMLVLPLAAAPVAGRAEAVPTAQECRAAIAHARAGMQKLPAQSMSRRFVQSDLVQAQSEGGNGEFDDCIEFTQKAEEELLRPRHLEPAAPAKKP
jgi:hypothetical protein